VIGLNRTDNILELSLVAKEVGLERLYSWGRWGPFYSWEVRRVSQRDANRKYLFLN